MPFTSPYLQLSHKAGTAEGECADLHEHFTHAQCLSSVFVDFAPQHSQWPTTFSLRCLRSQAVDCLVVAGNKKNQVHREIGDCRGTPLFCVDIPWTSRCAQGMCEVDSICTQAKASVLICVTMMCTKGSSFELDFLCCKRAFWRVSFQIKHKRQRNTSKTTHTSDLDNPQLSFGGKHKFGREVHGTRNQTHDERRTCEKTDAAGRRTDHSN